MINTYEYSLYKNSDASFLTNAPALGENSTLIVPNLDHPLLPLFPRHKALSLAIDLEGNNNIESPYIRSFFFNLNGVSENYLKTIHKICEYRCTADINTPIIVNLQLPLYGNQSSAMDCEKIITTLTDNLESDVILLESLDPEPNEEFVRDVIEGAINIDVEGTPLLNRIGISTHCADCVRVALEVGVIHFGVESLLAPFPRASRTSFLCAAEIGKNAKEHDKRLY